MPEVTDDDRKAMKERVKTLTDWLKDNQDILLVYPETMGAIEDAVADTQRKIALAPGKFEAPE